MATYKAPFFCVVLISFLAPPFMATAVKSNPTASTAVAPDYNKDFLFTLSSDKQMYTVEEQVTLRLTLANLSNEAANYVRSHPLESFDIRLRLPDGKEKSSPVSMYGNENIRIATLQPGATTTIVVPLEKYLDTSQRGAYKISATAVLGIKDGTQEVRLHADLDIIVTR